MAWFSRPDRSLFVGLDDVVGHPVDVLAYEVVAPELSVVGRRMEVQ